MATSTWANIGSGTGMLPPGPMLTGHQRCLATFNWEHFHRTELLTISIAVMSLKITHSKLHLNASCCHKAIGVNEAVTCCSKCVFALFYAPFSACISFHWVCTILSVLCIHQRLPAWMRLHLIWLNISKPIFIIFVTLVEYITILW